MAPTAETHSPKPTGNPFEVFRAFLKLGLTSFGGPVAHLGYFRTEFVQRRKWVSDDHYGQLVALCQFLPGPASSQVGFALGLLRGGTLGALAAWAASPSPRLSFWCCSHLVPSTSAVQWVMASSWG